MEFLAEFQADSTFLAEPILCTPFLPDSKENVEDCADGFKSIAVGLASRCKGLLRVGY